MHRTPVLFGAGVLFIFMISDFYNKKPIISDTVYVAPNAVIIGDVTIDEDSSIWFNTVVRGDVNYIKIGRRTNIQDNSVLHVTTDTHPLEIGDEVTAGHSVILHGCTVRNRVLIGMGSVVLDGAVLEENSFIAAGSVITPGFVAPSGKLVMGAPAKVKRDLTAKEIQGITESAENYVKNAKKYFGMDI